LSFWFISIKVVLFKTFEKEEAMSEKIDDFKMVHVSNVYSRNSEGQLVTQVNLKTESDMAVYGEVWGTITFLQNYETPDAESGEVSFAGEGFSPDGTKTIGFQDGTWKKVGKHAVELEMSGKDSREGNLKTVSKISLETLVWEGSVYRL
jgi:deferrochelatase/peroxidase EfeB